MPAEATIASEVVDIPKLMAEIRERIKADLAANPIDRSVKRFVADPGAKSSLKAGAVQYSEELHDLNRGWNFSELLKPQPVQTHRKGLIGKLIVRVKQKLLTWIWQGLFRGYTESENKFQMRLVQLLNLVARYTDERDAANFWELNRKIDYDVSKTGEKMAESFDDAMGTLRSVEKEVNSRIDSLARDLTARLTQLQSQFEQQQQSLATLDSVGRGLEGIVGRLSARAEPVANTVDYAYVLLENRFRGSLREIRSRLSIYPEIFRGATAPVLDLGAGRGELQLLFREAGVPSYGVDTDAGMIEEAHAQGADVRLCEGIKHLADLPDKSLGGLIAVQVVEHLPQSVLIELLDLCRRKIVAGGKVVFETINPQSVLALSSNYFRDPTHVFPIHPDTLSHTVTLAGLEFVEVRYLSPVPEGAKLKPVGKDEYMTPRWAFAVDTINQNFEQLNRLLYGDQDYCLIAQVR
jgi:O-antigen chain-terminating methyltransferase